MELRYKDSAGARICVGDTVITDDGGIQMSYGTVVISNDFGPGVKVTHVKNTSTGGTWHDIRGCGVTVIRPLASCRKGRIGRLKRVTIQRDPYVTRMITRGCEA